MRKQRSVTMQNETIETDIAEAENVETSATKTVAADSTTKPTSKARRKRSKAAGNAHNAARGIAPLVYSIPETCSAIGISERTYYNLPELERPKKIVLGDRVLHPVECVNEWLRARAK
jgi:hypothetical protein